MTNSGRSEITLVAVVLLMACPNGGGGDDEVGQTGGDAGETVGETGDGDGDGDGEPTCPLSLEGSYEPAQFDVSVEATFTPSVENGFAALEALCQPAEDDFQVQANIDWSQPTQGLPVELIVYRPADKETGQWPEGEFPVVFHHHGNLQRGEEYQHVADAIVDDGAIFVSVAEDFGGTPESRAMIDICMLRWLFTAEDWDGPLPGVGGASRLDGNVIVMGHSNAGEGAHIVYNWFEEQPWSDDPTAPEQDMRLCGVTSIAPRGAENANAPFSTSIEVPGPATVPHLTFEGSIDNDVPGGSLWNGSYSGLELPRKSGRFSSGHVGRQWC